MAARNRVKQAREREGISRAVLARMCDLSDRTLKKVEDGGGTVAPTTYHRIVKGFNGLPNKLRDSTYEYLFPNASTS